MKLFCTIIFFVFAPLGTIAQEYNYQAEDKYFEVFSTAFSECGVQLNKELAAAETALISLGVLESSQGESYRKLYSSGERNFVEIIRSEYSLRDTIASKFLCDPEALNIYSFYLFGYSEQDFFQRSKILELHANLRQVSGLTAEHSEHSNAVILNTLSDQDFSHPYFKIYALLNLENSCLSFETGIMKSLVFPKQKIETFDSLVIELGANSDSLKVDFQTIHKDKLKAFIKSALLGTYSSSTYALHYTITKIEGFEDVMMPNCKIFLNSKLATDYELYIETQDVIYQVIMEIRESISKEQFNKTVEMLSESEKQYVVTRMPHRFSEEAPK